MATAIVSARAAPAKPRSRPTPSHKDWSTSGPERPVTHQLSGERAPGRSPDPYRRKHDAELAHYSAAMWPGFPPPLTKGVLVSDFYTAYDALDMPQQRCLIHLMRDMNDDLLKHPFDEELKSIANKFSSLLKDIVNAIDWPLSVHCRRPPLRLKPSWSVRSLW